jgi:HK97 family phage prohead protease
MDFGCIAVPFEVKFDAADKPAGYFEGYGAVFGNIDSYGDVIEPGAFAKSLLERQRAGRPLPPMRAMHGKAKWGLQPIGKWQVMAEDKNGLHVAGQIANMDLESGKEVYGLLKDDVLSGLSVGYKVAANGAKMGPGRAGEPRRYLRALDLAEVSLVDDPANPLSNAYVVKSAASASPADEIKTIRDFEDFLRDAGFSRAAAKSIAVGGFKAQPDPRDEADIGEHIRARFAALASTIQK